MNQKYEESVNHPTKAYGKCPDCGAKWSKIQKIWHDCYIDMICSNGHEWGRDLEHDERHTEVQRKELS